MVIGGFRQLQKDVEKGYSDETSDVIQEALEKFLHDHVPPVRKARLLIVGVGLWDSVLMGNQWLVRFPLILSFIS